MFSKFSARASFSRILQGNNRVGGWWILTGRVTVHTEAVPPHVAYGLNDHGVTLAA